MALDLAPDEEIWHEELVHTAHEKKWLPGQVTITNQRVILRVARPKPSRGWAALGWAGLLFRAVDQAAIPDRVTGAIERADFESAVVEHHSVHIRSRGTGYAATWFTVETPAAASLGALLTRWAAGEDPRVPVASLPVATLLKP
jgi:hypothetical protein